MPCYIEQFQADWTLPTSRGICFDRTRERSHLPSRRSQDVAYITANTYDEIRIASITYSAYCSTSSAISGLLTEVEPLEAVRLRTAFKCFAEQGTAASFSLGGRLPRVRSAKPARSAVKKRSCQARTRWGAASRNRATYATSWPCSTSSMPCARRRTLRSGSVFVI
jgi:hypothetical protein